MVINHYLYLSCATLALCIDNHHHRENMIYTIAAKEQERALRVSVQMAPRGSVVYQNFVSALDRASQFPKVSVFGVFAEWDASWVTDTEASRSSLLRSSEMTLLKTDNARELDSEDHDLWWDHILTGCAPLWDTDDKL